MSLTDYVIMPGADYKDACDAVREKTVGTDLIKSGQMGGLIRGISGGGDSEIVKAICEFTEFELTGDSVEFVYGDFRNAISANTVCVNLPNATRVGYGAFSGFGRLKKAIFQNATDIVERAFYDCSNLIEIDFPKVETIGPSAFRACGDLTTVCFPAAVSIGYDAFRASSSGSKLEKVDLPVVTSIGDSAFADNNNLATVILRSTETVCVIELTAFYGTPILNLQGYIYVPTVMYEYYRAGYSDALDAAYAEMGVIIPGGVFNVMFRKIEDYPEICG